MTQTVYVPVEASGVNTYAVNIPSGADTTSGYYLSYNVGGENSGFTGINWYLDKPGNPFSGFQGISNEQDIIEYYESNQNLNAVFSTWINRVGEVAVSDFCNDLMHGEAYSNGCITMAR